MLDKLGFIDYSIDKGAEAIEFTKTGCNSLIDYLTRIESALGHYGH